jgi:hypothetical protein
MVTSTKGEGDAMKAASGGSGRFKPKVFDAVRGRRTMVIVIIRAA